MKIHYLQHVPFEDLGSLHQQFLSLGHTVSCTRLFAEDPLPTSDEFDFLVIMGGPMGIFDETDYPWLAAEKHFIKHAVDGEKKVLGICLGAQLIAHVLGARVFQNEHREIGWFPIVPSAEVKQSILSPVFTEPMTVFHWHGDTFDIPEDAVPIASSEACRNQGFIWDNRVAALQFHLESTIEAIEQLLLHCADELDGTAFVQSSDIIRSEQGRCAELNGTALAFIRAMGA